MRSREKLVQARKKLEEATTLLSEYIEDNCDEPSEAHVAVDKAVDRIFESACWVGLAVDSVANSHELTESRVEQ